MNIERMEHLAYKTLPYIEPEEFTMDQWLVTNCKTVGCAIGHEAQTPYATKEGLSLLKDAFGCMWPQYGGFTMFAAVALYFDIPEKDATKLFSEWGTSEKTALKLNTPAEVAARLIDYIEAYKAA